MAEPQKIFYKTLFFSDYIREQSVHSLTTYSFNYYQPTTLAQQIDNGPKKIKNRWQIK
jgi:hypothetical protein